MQKFYKSSNWQTFEACPRGACEQERIQRLTEYYFEMQKKNCMERDEIDINGALDMQEENLDL